MGIISKIFSLLLISSLVLELSAQTDYDTVYFSGKKFVEHVVKGGESLKSIATLHKVRTSDIKQSNELNKRLFYNQLLYIPVYLSNKDKDLISVKNLTPYKVNTDNSIIDIALLMPYYLSKNDSVYYNKSESALSFHVGVELAIDSLRRAGKNIILHTFDTNQDSLEVRKIVSSNQLEGMDIIIGPMYSKLFKMLCKRYGHDKSKTLISPLSRDNKEFLEFPSVYQISLTYNVQIDILTKYLIKNKLRERIIILNQEKDEGIATYLRYRFRKKNKTVESFTITHTEVDSIRKYFVEDQNVFLLSIDKAFISTMLGSIGSIDSISRVFSFESIISYDNLDITNLMELNVHIPNSRTIDYSNHYDLAFISLFEKEYNTNFRKYSKQGYDIIMHFCGNSNVYDFKRNKKGSYENISGPIFHYVEYDLLPAE